MFHLLVIHLNAAFPNDEKRHAAALRSWGLLHKPVGTKRTTCRKAVVASLPTLLKCKFPKMVKQPRSRDFSPGSRWRLLYHFTPPLGNEANGIFTARTAFRHAVILSYTDRKIACDKNDDGNAWVWCRRTCPVHFLIYEKWGLAPSVLSRRPSWLQAVETVSATF